MIKMQQIVNLLCDAELNNLVYVDSETKELNYEKLPALVRSINLGVLELHTRFNLKMGELLLNLQTDTLRYYLRPEYQAGKVARPGVTQYISAGREKFEAGNLLKVERVLDGRGYELELNVMDSWFGVTTPQYDILDVSPQTSKTLLEEKQMVLTIKYRKGSKLLVVCKDQIEDFCCQDVDIPYTHLQALVYFVANRSHNPLGFGQASAVEAQNYGQLYAAACSQLDALGLEVDLQGRNDRLTQGGWA